ncbi:MAG: hypothetical protein DLM65_11445 [Candidatus Aeolococcus gillhamiae]|uniref:Uncharacterized protein n=1 Tax=Candidatus Aeolococcus gillhamiae TaxID=3127015 RepID=A0A2W5Z8F8_9BACT|nr:MAG: hypothetical protein DLM65_11445 [Candidatus Dormibacter sp. RRmetagenome_bin12]
MLVMRAGAEATTRAPGAVLHATWRAFSPLLHSTLLPTSMREEQQGQTEANLAVMIMADSVVVGRWWWLAGGAGRSLLPTTINLSAGCPARKCLLSISRK